MSIGRVQSSLAQATQELTVAAVNLNFDFTLVNFEAPAEYQGIGHILNPSRVREAETGPIHLTASRLGALFEAACPQAPNLIKAYGTRASEISKEVSESESERSNGGRHNWIRNEYGGIDATSIWAAATSSKHALPVHLLACIIARMWTHTEATSVWVEIVAERKREMTSKYEEGEQIPLTVASAVHQEITRDHLSKWDASARAWLQTADKARQRQYKQFLLIAKNLSIAVHQENNPLYTNVMNVWSSALIAMEGLISGIPHAVQSGPILLGISAWHIFPDMLVFDSPTGNLHIPMDDPLVKPGGVLSLGISDTARNEEQGVYWSLSLSHHRYYGEAVRRTRRLESDGSRLSFNELVLVCLGSFFRVWSIPKRGTDSSIKILQKLREVIPQQSQQNDPNVDWQTMIEQPLKQYADGDKQAELAIALGRRRPQFLPQSLTSRRAPLFGLLDLSNLLYVLKEDDKKISLLRRIAGRVPGLDNSNSIILCAVYYEQTDAMTCQYVTIFPRDTTETKTSDRNTRQKAFHRWIDIPSDFLNTYKKTIDSAMHKYKKATRRYKRSQPFRDGVDPFVDTMKRALLRPRLNLCSWKTSSAYDGDGRPVNLRGGFAVATTDKTNDPDDIMTDAPNNDAAVSELDTNPKNPGSAVDARSVDINVTDDGTRSHEKNRDKSVPDNAGRFEGSSFTEDSDQRGIVQDLDETQRRHPGNIDDRITFPPEFKNEDRACQDAYSSAQATFKAVHEKALKNLEECCSTYLTERERELPGETFEYQNLLENEVPQWTYERFRDVVKSSSDLERFAWSFGRSNSLDYVDSSSSGEHAVVYTKNGSKPNAGFSGVGNEAKATLDDILWCFEYDMVDLGRLRKLLANEPAFAFLEVLAAAGEIYRQPTSGGATISCSIINEPFDPPIFSETFGQDDWIKAPSHIELNETTAIALIGYFETGHNVIDSMKGKYNIIGFSGGDSIFVCTAILNDPDTFYPNYSFTRILGNTGKAGFSVLTSPSELMVRKLDPTAWRVESTSFDGSPLDSFKQTSLHLRFTDWQAPVVQCQSVGQRDADINIVEAVVSVRDAGKWVADVDIYRALLSPQFCRLQMIEGCKLHPPGTDGDKYCGQDQEEIISIETWDQVLDQVDGRAVARCFDNWVARLAIVAVLCQRSKENEQPVVVCSKRVCWKCHADHLSEGTDYTYIF